MVEKSSKNTDPSLDNAGHKLLRSAWRRSRPGLAVILLFSVFINLLKLAVPLYVLHILNRVIASGSLETLGMLTVITLIAVICGVLLEVVRRRMFMAWGNWIEALLGPRLFIAAMKTDKDKISSTGALRDLSTVRSFVSGQSLIAWLDVGWAPFFIAVVFLIAPQLGYIVLGASLIALLLGSANEFFTRDSRNATYKAGKADREWVAMTERDPESAGSLNQMNGLADLWSRDASERSQEGMRTRAANINFSAALRLIGRLVRIGVFGVGIWLVIDGTLTLGAVIAANVLGRMSYSLVSSAMLKWRDLVLAKRAYAQIKGILRKERSGRLSRLVPSSKPALVVDDVAYRYPEQSTSVFRRMNVMVQPGEVLCLLGPSAAGKTTFCRLVSGLVAARSGKILLGDNDVYHLQQNSPKREIGYLPQEYTLFQGSVRDNIAATPNNDMRMVVWAAKLAGIHEMILKLPEGYDTEIVDKEPRLSAGQRKAVAIARTLYGLPAVLVMDEPFAHLDTDLQRGLIRGLYTLRKRGTIIVLTTQQKALARLADKIILFQDNKHLLLQTAKELNGLQKLTSGTRSRSRPKKNSRRERRSSKDRSSLKPV